MRSLGPGILLRVSFCMNPPSAAILKRSCTRRPRPNPNAMPSTAQDLRRVILDTTRHLLIEEGYNNLSMRKIARAIGYSATSIYLYFKDKDDLFHTLIEEGYSQLQQVFKAIETSYDNGSERLKALCRAYIRFGLDNPEYYEVMFLLHPEHMARYPAEKYRRARRNLDVIASALDEGTRQGVFSVENPRVTASTIWAALHGAVSLLIAQRVDIRIDPQAFIETTLNHTLRGVQATSATV